MNPRLAALERDWLARRAGPADPPGAVEHAFATACAGQAPAAPLRGALAVAAEVARHGAAFAPGQEPAYHDRHHQAEATLAMAALAGEARGAGYLDLREVALLLLAMAGHDLLHDGSIAGPPGRLEAISAEAVGRIAAAAGVDDASIAELRRLILLTEVMQRPAADDLPGRLMREADLMGSLMPTLGWRLSAQLARERAAAGAIDDPPVDHFAGRLRLLRAVGAETVPAITLGMDRNRRDQIAAFALAGEAGTAEAGAAALDALPRDVAERRYRDALARIDGGTDR